MANDGDRLLSDIAAYAEELAEPRQHRESRWTWTASRHRKKLPDHVTVQPGLLVQLHEAAHPLHDSAHPAAGDSGSTTRPAASSAPPVRLEALSALLVITMAVNVWCGTLTVVNRGQVVDNVRGLVGGAARADTPVRRQLAGDMRSWRNWAAVMTGWAEPDYAPYDATCPEPDCRALGTIRIRLAAKTAMCIECMATWSDADGNLAVLAEHITADTARPRPPATRVGSTVAGLGAWHRHTFGGNA